VASVKFEDVQVSSDSGEIRHFNLEVKAKERVEIQNLDFNSFKHLFYSLILMNPIESGAVFINGRPISSFTSN